LACEKLNLAIGGFVKIEPVDKFYQIE